MGVLSGLSDFLFGVDKLDTARETGEMARLQADSDAFKQREALDYAHQDAYARALEEVIAGNTMSAAQRQFQANADQINRSVNSTVSGASGNTGALARYGAILSQGDALAQANQAAQVQQANEIAIARQMLGGAYANMGARSAALYGNVVNAGLGYDQIIAQKQMANQRADAAAQGALLGAGATLGASLIGGPAVAAAPVAAAGVNSIVNANTAGNGGGYGASLNAGGAGAPAYVMSDPLSATAGTSVGTYPGSTASSYGPALNYTDYPTTTGERYPSYSTGRR
ncbi:MAG TPA: hypothetical protein VLZ78_02615 [Terrimesophilobacter sp.]|nr:hypothetical protein [Terrimesophilobacter sp.]